MADQICGGSRIKMEEARDHEEKSIGWQEQFRRICWELVYGVSFDWWEMLTVGEAHWPMILQQVLLEHSSVWRLVNFVSLSLRTCQIQQNSAPSDLRFSWKQFIITQKDLINIINSASFIWPLIHPQGFFFLKGKVWGAMIYLLKWIASEAFIFPKVNNTVSSL
jgi:hypothetical protein